MYTRYYVRSEVDIALHLSVMSCLLFTSSGLNAASSTERAECRVAKYRKQVRTFCRNASLSDLSARGCESATGMLSAGS